MTVASSSYLSSLIGDPELSGLIDDAASLRAMVRVEVALARVEGRLGVIPAEAYPAIEHAAKRLAVEPTHLAEETARDGVPVPALVARLRKAVGEPYADYVHFGATSQDIVDTAFVLTSIPMLGVLDLRLEAIIRGLIVQAERHVGTLMAGRTRHQLAAPTTFGLKAAGWALPLHRHRQRLVALRSRLAYVSLAGATGNLASLAGAGLAVEAALAAELGLDVPVAAWHSTRDGVAELGHWLALVTGSLGKIGTDILALAQSEIAEVRPSGGGRSSTMPHKTNPVAAETLVALARTNADRISTLHHALLHEHERDGAAWMLEWTSIPDMAIAAGASTRIALQLVETLHVDVAVMRARADDPPGLLASELAAFALSAVIPPSRAWEEVASAADVALATGRSLIEVLATKLGDVVDWTRLRTMDDVLEAAAVRTERILLEVRAPILQTKVR